MSDSPGKEEGGGRGGKVSLEEARVISVITGCCWALLQVAIRLTRSEIIGGFVKMSTTCAAPAGPLP